jgi:flagellar biosynthesis protein FliR
MSVVITDQILLVAFWLTFTRCMAVMFQLPIFDSTAIPPMIKVLGSLVISYAFFPYVKESIINEIHYVGPGNFWFLTMSHTIVGLFIGFLAKSIMGLFTASGSLMTQQIGFNSVSYFDPSFGQRIGPFEKAIKWTLVILILSSGALIPMFKGMVTSFSTMNLISFGKFSATPDFYLRFFKSMFMSAIMLASPLLFINFILNLIMGIIARTIPQMNILMVSFAVNIGLGLLVFFAISEEYFQVAFELYTTKLGEWFQFIS